MNIQAFIKKVLDANGVYLNGLLKKYKTDSGNKETLKTDIEDILNVDLDVCVITVKNITFKPLGFIFEVEYTEGLLYKFTYEFLAIKDSYKYKMISCDQD